MSITTMILSRAARTAGGAAVAGIKTADKIYSWGTDKITSAAFKGLDKVGGFAMDHANIVKMDEHGMPSGFNGKGKLALTGITATAMASNALTEDERKHLGTTDGRIVTATPDYSVYRNGATMSAPGGADGSLVFALDKTKNGGFL